MSTVNLSTVSEQAPNLILMPRSKVEVQTPANPDDVDEFVGLLNTADRMELEALSQAPPQWALTRGLALSDHTWEAFLDHFPVAMGGLTLRPAGEPATVWMVACTHLLHRHRLSFSRASRQHFEEMKLIAPHMRTNVDITWVKSVLWLKWLGFAVVADMHYVLEDQKRHGLVMEYPSCRH